MARQQQLSVQDAFSQGMSHYEKGHLKPAVGLFSEIVRAAPQFAPAHHMLGLIAFQTGQLDPAVKALGEAVRLQPENGNFLTNFTEVLRVAGQLDQAREIGERAARIVPGSAAAHSNLGLVYYDQGHLDQAEASQERALALAPEFDRAINNLGSIARDNGDRDKAALLYQKALRVNPASAETANNLISVLIEVEKLSEARSVAENRLEKTPRDAELHRNFGRLFMLENDLDKAENAFRNAISLDGNKADSFVGLSQVLFEKNHPKLALIEAEQALRLDENSATACHQAAMAKAHLGDVAGATALYERAMELKPDLTASRLALGHLAIEQGDFEIARQHFETAAESADDKLSALIALARLEKVTEESPVFQQLEAVLPDAADMLPQKAVAYRYAMGDCYEKLGRYDEAFENYEKGARIKRSLVAYDTSETDELTDDLIATFDQSMIERLRGNSISSEKPIFVVGMPRSGTTLTESILDAHPEVVGAGELNDLQNLFGRLDDGASNVPRSVRSVTDETLTRRAEDYVDALSLHAPGAGRVVDKMPANFQLIGLIHGIMPNAKIIHIDRDPLDICLSCYTRLFERSQLHSYDQEELGRYYNNYVRLMNHWHATLPKGAFHSIRYEELVDDIDSVARGIIDYCGLEWTDACLEFYSGKRRVRTASVQQVRQPLYSSSKAKWRRYERHLQPLIDTIGDRRIVS
ncbi:tetratricopeptide repeat-containing sulfotransferase family protein [Roseibium sp. RKSG952]|uniref:tetratricopeptide repeat-containing sulfotransferase family protein n=1 Tax=Roseibium sp. RKSG952 TaxID=2529384 RepID=UPI0012BC2AC7|nr:tetratricopeptide repeat-containing sulfotransferase family protein [Roseibium sp. RKSG952]MTI02425.1 sulfotransferase family protein [Roseibium sp. RKSG952]